MQIRGRLTYANVMSTIGVFLLLATGAAVAAKMVLPKKSVGTKQLKANAVTTAKIKKNAVTKAKIRRDAVDGSKIADGAVTGSEINAASTPFSRIVYEARGNAIVAVPTSPNPPAPYPLANPAYTQEPESDDTYFGAVDVTFQPTCNPPRNATAYLVVDPSNPNQFTETETVGVGAIQDQGSGASSRRIHIGPYFSSVRFQQATPTNHSLHIFVQGSCDSGTTGITASFGAVDVIGTK